MMSRLLLAICRLAAHLPLGVLQALGALLGRAMLMFSSRFAQRIDENLRVSQIGGTYQEHQALVKQTARHIGMGGIELLLAWFRPSSEVAALVKHCEGWEHVEASLAAGRGILFVTPHLGNYDIAGRYLSERLPCPLTAMYRPPKLAWLEPIMNAGRARDTAKTAPATGAGVRLVMKALKSGEATIILPDQVPGQGDGEWAPFFGRPAYTMTLVPRLGQMNQVDVLFFYGRRLARGEGFSVHIRPLNEPFDGERSEDARRLNAMVETLIREAPEQYLWSYNRYKTPSGVTPPSSTH